MLVRILETTEKTMKNEKKTTTDVNCNDEMLESL